MAKNSKPQKAAKPAKREHEPKVKHRKRDKGLSRIEGYTSKGLRDGRHDRDEQAAVDAYAAQQRDLDIVNTLAIADAAWANVKEADHAKGLGFHIYRCGYLRRAACQTGRWYVMERVSETHFRMIAVALWAEKWLADVQPGTTARHNKPNLAEMDERQRVTAFKLWRAQCEAILDSVHANGGGMAYKWNGNKSPCPWLSTDYLEVTNKQQVKTAA